MKAFLKSVVAGLLALVLTGTGALAQERPAFSPEQLDQMLAPIALYPDSLLSQVLMAATYPLEVVQAARWSRANPNLKGQDAVRAVEPMDWDPSVKSLVAFPQILYRLDEQLDWTQRLGEAFIVQEPQVMESIQGLRQRAAAAGNLGSSAEMRVSRQGGDIVIEPPGPQAVYVPYYNPAIVYGTWWWPAYPPVYWGPPAGYYAGPGYWPGFFWGSGIAISAGFFYGHFNWPHRQVTVVQAQPTQVVVNRQVTVNQRSQVTPDHMPVRWQHDPVHRRGVPYRYTAARQPFGQPPAIHSNERSSPVTGREPRSAQQEPRNAAPPPRALPAAPNPRPGRAERFTPQLGDRLPERSARTEIQPPQLHVPAPRPVAAVPRAAPVTRPIAPVPVARAEIRPTSPAANVRAAPWQQSVSSYRAEPPTPARPSSMIPRAAASAPTQVPRATGSYASGGASTYGGGNQRAMSAGRGGSRS